MGRIKVVFFCVGKSAGSKPQKEVNPYTLKVLEKRGIPTDGLRPKKLEEIPLKELDYVFVLCKEEECPNILNVKKKSRAIPDPAKVKGTPEEVGKLFEETLNRIEEKVLHFLREYL